MTLVMALKENDQSILIGADSEQTDEHGLKSVTAKLHQVKDLPLMCGTSGNADIGNRLFTGWLDGLTMAGADWLQFSELASEHLSDLNGAQRQRSKSAMVQLTPGVFTADAILAGWLQGHPDIFALSEDGRFDSAWQRGFLAIETGSHSAVAIYNCFKYLSRIGEIKLTPERIARLILDVVALTVPNCGPPVELWRIGPAVCHRLERWRPTPMETS
jgi:hypothetical protein